MVDDPLEQKSYGKVYFLASLALLFSILWAIWDEAVTRRPWKYYQLAFNEMEYKQVEKKLESLKAKLTENHSNPGTPLPGLPEGLSYSQLLQNLKKAQEELQHNSQYKRLLRELKRVNKKLYYVNQDIQFAKAKWEEVSYQFKIAKRRKEDYQPYSNQLRVLEDQIKSFNPKKQELEQQKIKIEKALKKLTADYDKYQRYLQQARAEIDKLERRLKSIKGRWPQIKQVVIQGYARNNFGQPILKVDRCQSCHLGADRVGFEEAPEPFRTHPKRELYLANHPPEKFGCTVCHRGQGNAVDSVKNAHGSPHETDQTPGQNEPLLKGPEIQASCRKCHNEVADLPGAPLLSQGKRLFKDLGCYGCHIIKGLEESTKPAPDLRRIASKVNPGWLFRWIKEPKKYLSNTKMPNFGFNEQESMAVAAYLWSTSERPIYNPPANIVERELAQQKGEDLINVIGCRGCHRLEDIPAWKRIVKGKIVRDFAPNLYQIANKVKEGWLFNWIQSPREYFPNTRMPNLRLTEEEAQVITAYLMTLGEAEENQEIENKLLDKELIAQGKKLIIDYGCYGCHEIKGMEKQPKFGTELTTFGEKKSSELEFGYVTDIELSWSDWVTTKLKEPRKFSTDRIKLKMPTYQLTDQEILALKVFLKSLTSEKIPRDYVQVLSGPAKDIEEGRKLIRYYNCQGCHQLEGKDTKIVAYYESRHLAPPILDGEGFRVQPKWLYNFLMKPITLRPWLQVRMPTFPFAEKKDSKQVLTLVRYFRSIDKQDRPYIFVDTSSIPKESIEIGSLLTSKKYFNCFKCHQQGEKPPEEEEEASWSIDLVLAKDRLNPDWIVRFLQDPKKINEKTKMPSFFFSEDSGPEEVLNGDEQKQILAIRDFLLTLGLTS
jgi:cytochrome c2